jgi:hypothetical protein
MGMLFITGKEEELCLNFMFMLCNNGKYSIVDSILGALCLPDIGQLFPDNDPAWKNADSSIFMEEVISV